MVYSYRPPFLFIEIEKTGSTSVRRYLLREFSDSANGTNRHRTEIPPGAEDLPVFACVRNPYSRLFSHYVYRMNTDVNVFGSTVMRPQKWDFTRYVRWVCGVDDTDIPQEIETTQFSILAEHPTATILRFESLESDFCDLPFIDDHAELPLLNTSKRPELRWQDAYDEELASLVHAWARKDFESYDYRSGCWQEQDVPGRPGNPHGNVAT